VCPALYGGRTVKATIKATIKSTAMSSAPYRYKTLAEIVESAASGFGDAPAISDGDVTLSYSDLNSARLQAARAFCAAGVEVGDRISIWAPNIYQWVVAAIGAQSIGAVLVPLSTRMKGMEAGYQLRASGARLLFTVTDFLDVCFPALLEDEDLPDLEGLVLFEGEYAGAQSWESFLAAGESVDAAEVQRRQSEITPDHVLDILFTSGTTGKPKGVVTTHGQNIRVFETWSNTVGLGSSDKYLIINPFFHSFGYKAGWLSCLITGAQMFPVRVFDLDKVMEQIERDRISMLPGPPTIYQSLLAHPNRTQFDLSSLRLAVTGAAAVPVELIRKIRSELGFDSVVTAYGLTETCGTVSICRADDDPETIATTSGTAMPGVEVVGVDGEGREVGRGEPGEIMCRGFNVMHEYFNDPEETARAISEDGWLKTGDVGVMDERGYIRITDRIKDMFIVGGFNCYPAEIENILCNLEGVAQAAVIGVPDERMGEVASAYIVPAAGSSLTEDAVINWARSAMSNYKVPRSVHFLDALPLNASGKVVKPELRRLAESRPLKDLGTGS
jgi:acyl-CoA synthetase (AMP-forming)/AMP-acid ligase II